MAAEAKTVWVNVPVTKAIALARTCGELVSLIQIKSPQGIDCTVIVIEKYYARMAASSVATLVFQRFPAGGAPGAYDSVKVTCVCAGSGINPEFGANAHFQKKILASLKDVVAPTPGVAM
jgi:hypothetical protein